MICVRCRSETGVEKPGRRDECPSCGADLHACIQCTFYDPGAYNDCREPQAERVLDKEQGNFCDYFRTGNRSMETGKQDEAAAAKARLDALFAKKS